MRKKALVVLLCLIGMIIFVSTLHGQSSKKTITLPNGEVIWDLNGEWDAMIENYGNWGGMGTYPNVWRITQKGSEVTAIRLKANPPPAHGEAGSQSVIGELDKNGFKELTIVGGSGWVVPGCKWQISEDGNKIFIDATNHSRIALTRK